MCDHPNREGAMVTIKPGVWCDPCLVPIVRALNNDYVGLPTVVSERFGTKLATIASCCGHGKRPGKIALADGRELFVLPDFGTARRFDDLVHRAMVDGEGE